MRLIKSAGQPMQAVSHDPGLVKRVILPSGTVPFITQFAATSLPPGGATRSHVHGDMTEVFLVVEGSACVQVANCSLRLDAGDCLVVEPGEAHHLTNDGATDLRMIYFGVAPRAAEDDLP